MKPLQGPPLVVEWAEKLREEMLRKYEDRPELLHKIREQTEPRWFIDHRDYDFKDS